MRKLFLLLFSLLIGTGFSQERSIAKWYTSMGEFSCELYDDLAPITAQNFIDLATGNKVMGDSINIDYPFYDHLIFHRVISDFMIQDGCPLGTGSGGPGYEFDDEFGEGLNFDNPGVLAMANAGPNTNGSQYFITVAPYDYGNGNYAIFGHTVENYDVVERISNVKTNGSDRPLVDVKIDSVRIMDFYQSNPLAFEDTVLTEAITIDLSEHFNPRSTETPLYMIESSEPEAAVVSLDGSIATIEPGTKNGTSTVTLKASMDNGAHSMELIFYAANYPNPTPKSGMANCLMLDGADDYFELPESNSENYADLTELDASGWFKFNDISANQGLISKSSMIFNGWWLQLKDGFLHAEVNTSSDRKKLETDFTPLTDRWYHLSLCCSANELKIEVFDNKSKAVVYTANTTWDDAVTIKNKDGQSIFAGKFSGFYLNGFVDNVFVYNKILSPEERALVRVATEEPADSESLLAYASFDSNYGTESPCAGIGVAETGYLHNGKMISWQKSDIKATLLLEENSSIVQSFTLPGDYLYFNNVVAPVITIDPVQGTLTETTFEYPYFYSYTPNAGATGLDSLSYYLSYSDGAGIFNSEEVKFYFDLVNSLKSTESELIPEKSAISSCYPNPFNPEVKITFNIVNSQKVKLAVYDIQGKEVDVLTHKFYNKGRYSKNFNGKNLASGVYFVKLFSADKQVLSSQKITLLK